MTDLAGLRLLRRIEEGVAGKSDEAFFRQIVRELTLALNAHAAFTSRLLPERHAEMLAFWVDGRYEKLQATRASSTPSDWMSRQSQCNRRFRKSSLSRHATSAATGS